VGGWGWDGRKVRFPAPRLFASLPEDFLLRIFEAVAALDKITIPAGAE
jgi:hypothetical protein